MSVRLKGTMKFIFVVALALALTGNSSIGRLLAQGTTASIQGVVTDSSGAAVPGAAVQVKNIGTGTTQATQSDLQGRYTAAELGVGEYEVQASKSGFSTVVHKGITLTVGAQSVVDFSLPVGQAQQTVTVEGQVSQVETTNSSVGALIDQRQVRELPLNGRNFQQLIYLSPGIQVITSTAPIGRQGKEASMSAAGSRPEGQAILLDDEDLQNFYRRGVGTVTGTSLGVEAIAEFQTLTNTYSAQFGGNGVVINSVSKSGTNTFHGSAYDFLRNSAMDARSPFDPGSSPPSFRKNQYGASLGGPIKTDKMFFFFNYEGIRQLLGESKIITVPDASHRTALPSVTDSNVAAAIAGTLALYPLPTFNLNAAAGTGQYTEVANQIVHENYYLARWDYTVSQKDALFLRFVLDKQYLLEPNPPSGSLIPLWPETDYNANYFNTLEWRRIITPSIVNTARASFSRPNTPTYSTSSTPALQFFPASSGRPNATVTIQGLSLVGPNPMAPATQLENKFGEADDLLWTHGSHTMRFGAAVLRQDTNVFFPVRSGSSWSFPSLAVFQAGGNAQTTLTGTPLGAQYYPYRNYREIDFSPYVQDDWKVTSKLTLNLGLRWEFTTNPVDHNNAFYAVTDYAHGTAFVNVPHATQSNASWWNLDPRIGFAYDLFADHKTAIRGGFAITHSPIYVGNFNPNYSSSPPWNGLTQSNPIYGQPFTAVSPVLPSVATGFDWHINTAPYLAQYNLNIQREILNGTVLTVGFVGSHGVHLLTQQDQNPPFATVDAGGVYHFATVNAAGSPVVNARLNSNFSFLEMAVPDTTSRYNSLQVAANRRLTKDVQAQLAYTFSRCIDDGGFPIGSLNGGNSPTAYENPYDRSIDRGLCFFNVKHALRINAMYVLPFHGNRVVSGWQLSGIASATSGYPFSISTGYDRVGYASTGTPRPNYVSGCQVQEGTVAQWFNPACFSLQAAGTLGDVGRDTVIGPNSVDVDMALLKDTNITEKVRVQIRAELFNLFNHPSYGLPNASIFTASGPNPTAGQITTIVGTSRQVQFGLKIIF